MADARYIINLILNARDNTADALNRATGNLRGYEAAQRDIERQNREVVDSFRRVDEALDRNTSRIDRARESFRRFSNEAVRAEVELQRAAEANARAQANANATAAERERALRNLDAATRRYRAALVDASRMEEEFSRSGARRRADRIASSAEEIEYVRNYTRQIQFAAREEERISRERQQRQARELQAPRRYLELLRQIQRLERDRANVLESGDTVARARLGFDDREARRKAAVLADELRLLFRDAEINVNLDDSEARAHAEELLALKSLLGRDIELNVDVDVSRAIAQLEAFEIAKRRAAEPNAFDAIRIGVARVGDSFTDASQKIATFDNFLRGLAAVSIFAFFNQLILLAGSAASNLLSLASSAGVAGATLGGTLAAGLAQALPMLGIFATALTRLNAVMNAVRQADLLQQQQSYQAPAQNRRVRNSIDGVISAQERLADAHRRVKDAQEDLTQARETARQKLEDLILTERGARLSVDEAQSAIRNATSVSDLDRAFLNRDEANLNLRRTSADLATRRSAGIAGAPEVQDAQQRVEDARRSVAQAQRDLARATVTAQVAEENITAAAGKLNYLLEQLSPAERRLYDTLTRLQDEFRRTSQVIVEPIINSMIRSFERLIDVGTSPRVVDSMTRLAEGMARAGDRVTDRLLSDRQVDQFLRITDQARENIAPMTDIVISLGQAFTDLAEAAGPALRSIILWVRDISLGIERFFRVGRETGRLGDFFAEGVRHIRAWADLLYQIVRLFAAIAMPGGGADAGFRLITRLADAIEGFADRINDTDSRTSRFFRQFFEVGQRMLFALTPVLEALAIAFAELFDEEGVRNVEAFAFFLSDILIPAVARFADTVGRVTTFVMNLIREFPILRDVLASTIAVLLSASVFGRIATIFSPAVTFLRVIGGLLLGRQQMLTRIIALLGRVPLIGALIGGGAAAAGAGVGAGGIAAGAAAGAASRLILPRGIEADAARQGGRLGRLFGGGFRSAAGTLLRRAGWIGVGISAVSGIMSAFRYDSVRAGIQNFASSMSFGLIDSFEESTDKRLREALRTFDRTFRDQARVLDIDTGRAAVDRLVARPQGGARSVPGTFGFREIDRARQIFDSIRDRYGDDLADRFDRAYYRYARILDLMRRSASSGARIVDFARTESDIREIGSMISELTRLIDITPRGALRDYFIDLRREAINTGRAIERGLNLSRLNIDFAQQLQTDRRRVRGVVDDYIRELRRFPIGARRQAGNALVEITRVLESRGDAPVGAANQLAERLDRANVTWTRRWRNRTAAAADNTNKLINALLASVSAGATGMVEGVNNVLSAFGVRSVRVPVIGRIPIRDITQGASTISAIAGLFRARGGFIGSPGERGSDNVPAILGRGEAVLNWAHQRVVEPAMRAFYGMGLSDMFRRTRGLHAGAVPGGYAGGGFTGPAGSGAGFIPIANFAANKFGLQMTAGRTDHSYYTSSGNVSDHSKGLAGDFSNSTAPTPQMDGFNAFWKTRLPQTVKQLIWRNIDQFQGFPVSGHMDHVHLAVHQAYAFNSALMARLISRASKGLSIARLLSSAGSLDVGGDQIDHIHRVIIRGSGPLVEFANRALRRIQRAANKYIDSKSDTDLGNIVDGPNDIDLLPKGRGVTVGASQFGGPSDPSTGTTGYRGDNLALKPDSYAELSNNPGAGVGGDFAALGGLPYLTKLRITGPRGSAIAYKRDVGAGGGAVNGVQRAIDLWYSLAQTLGVSGLGLVKIQRLASGGLLNGIQQFATGGSVRGPDGHPVPIIAHAGEWVLNRVQQSRLARLVGLGLDQVQGLLGFPGAAPKSHFQEGGVVASRYVQGPTYTDVEGQKQTEESRKQTREAQEQTRLTRQQLEEQRDSRRREREERARRAYEESTTYSGPSFNIAPTSVSGIRREIADVFRAISAIGRGRIGRGESFGQQVDRFNRSIRWLLGDNGYLYTLGDAIDSAAARMTLSVNLAQAGLRRVGSRLLRRRPVVDDVRIADLTIRSLRENEQDIVRYQQVIIRAIRSNNRRLRSFLARAQRENRDELRELQSIDDPDRRQTGRIRELQELIRGRRVEDRLSQRQIDRYRILTLADQELKRRLDENTQRRIDAINAIREQRLARRDSLVERFTSRTDRLLSRPTRAVEVTDAEITRAGINERDEDFLAPLLRRRLQSLRRQREIIQNRLARAIEAARRNPAMNAVVNDLRSQLTQLETDIIQASRDIADNILAGLERQLNTILEDFDTRNQSLGRDQQVASARGRQGDLNTLTQRSIDLANEEIRRLMEILPQYVNAPELRRQIEDRIADLGVTVIEATADLLQNAINAVEDAAGGRERALGLRDRLRAVRERLTGDRLGSIRESQAISDGRVASLTQQRDDLFALRLRAELEENEGAVRDLTERLEELNVQIEEENATRRELVYEYRQAALDLITGQADRSTGLLGAARDILQRVADISGTSVVDTLLRFAQQTSQILRDEASRIISGVNESIFGGEFGEQGNNILMQLVGAFANGPESFATTLAALGPAIAALESTMGDVEREAFQRLIAAMLDNTGAVLDNTSEIDELNGAVRGPQTWATSAWQWFREAIFNGMGDVMPQYAVPQMTSGGWVARGGLSNLAPGGIELRDRTIIPSNNYTNNFEINEAGGPIDMTHLANRIGFVIKSQR